MPGQAMENMPRTYGDAPELIAAGQGASVSTFFLWHGPDLTEFVACRRVDCVSGSRKALGLGREAFANLISSLPGW